MRKVPSTFELMGSTITVKLRPDLAEAEGCWGRWHPHKHLIEIQDGDVTKAFQLQTFWHEAVHAVLEHIGRSDLSDDEGFVDALGQAIYQILKTKR